MSELFETRFIAEYLKDHNATQAYIRVNPTVAHSTAKSYACRLLQKPTVAAKLQEYSTTLLETSRFTKDGLILEAVDILDKAKSNKKYGPAMQAVEFVAKVKGYFDATEDDYTKYSTVIQNIQVNNYVQPAKIIDQSKVITECVNRTDSLNSGEIEQKPMDSGVNGVKIGENE